LIRKFKRTAFILNSIFVTMYKSLLSPLINVIHYSWRKPPFLMILTFIPNIHPYIFAHSSAWRR